MEPHWIINSIILIALGVATVTDIKKREVPDTLNFGLMILGVLIGMISSIVVGTWQYFLSSIIGLAIGYAIGALMFYTGQWGGGDSKMLMGMGALIGVGWTNISGFWSIISGQTSVFAGIHIPFFITTILTIFIAGGLYGLIYTLYLIIINWKEFKIEFRKKREEKKVTKMRIITLIIAVLCGLGIVFVNDKFIRIVLGLIGIMVFFTQYMYIISKVVEKVCLIKIIPLRQLTEGDWIVEDVIVKGKRICGPKDLGVSLKQMEELKKKKVKKIKIKEGIPFIPGFLLGYLAMVLLGNWILFFV